MRSDVPSVVVTRAVPGAFIVPGATVRVLGNTRPTRARVLRGISGVTAVATMFTDVVDDEFLDAAGPGLRVVAHYAQGHDTIDLRACARRNVQVSVTPDVVTQSTADMAWALLLAVARRVVEADAYARSDRYPRAGQLSMQDFLGMDLAGKTMLIVGAGRIGHGVAMRSLGWGMRVLYVARSRHPEFENASFRASKVSLLRGLALADIVSVHTPLTQATKHLIDANAIAAMKRDAIIINTARGPVIDEASLARALRAGKLAGAGLDVFEHEPRVHPLLRRSSRVVLSPHIGSAAKESRERQTAMVAANIAAVLRGEPAPNAIVPLGTPRRRI
jgi:glyoxylate reductase